MRNAYILNIQILIVSCLKITISQNWMYVPFFPLFNFLICNRSVLSSLGGVPYISPHTDSNIKVITHIWHMIAWYQDRRSHTTQHVVHAQWQNRTVLVAPLGIYMGICMGPWRFLWSIISDVMMSCLFTPTENVSGVDIALK